MTDSVLTQVLNSVKSTIAALPQLNVQNVEVQKVATLKPKDEIPLPAILITTTGGEQVDSAAGGWLSTTSRNLIVYPIIIYDVEKTNDNYGDTNIDPQLTRRQRIRRAFHDKRLSGVSENMIVHVSPDPIVAPASFKSAKVRTSALKLNVICRESRSTAIV